MPGIYIHIPFCRRKCVYCDFYSVAQTGKTDDLLNGILLEAVRNKHFFNSSPLSTLYIGGGSPGILAADKISSFVNQLGDIYDLSRLQEFTVELNPEDAVPEYLETLRSSGVNRISIGIQSTHNKHLLFLGRRHNSEFALQSL
ncbi:MAG: radical SAM protein, partial [Bacteroidales bacterium]|nr:radical SAM protein [Bacteroidales bacterium]